MKRVIKFKGIAQTITGIPVQRYAANFGKVKNPTASVTNIDQARVFQSRREAQAWLKRNGFLSHRLRAVAEIVIEPLEVARQEFIEYQVTERSNVNRCLRAAGFIFNNRD